MARPRASANRKNRAALLRDLYAGPTKSLSYS